MEQAKRTGFNVQVSSSAGTHVALSYQARFTRGEGVEEFLWQIRGKEAKLLAYNINSLELIMR
jgi:hypothetical protein